MKLHAKKEIVRKYYKYVAIEQAWEQPVLSSDGTIGGDSFAVSANTESGYPAYQAFDNSTNTFTALSTDPKEIIIYNPNPLKPNQIRIINRNYPAFYIQTGEVYVSDDNANYTLIKSFTSTATGSLATYTIDLTNNLNFYKYWKIKALTHSSSYWEPAEITMLNTTEKVITTVESTIGDYDFYKDVEVWKTPSITTRKYYKYISSPWTQPILDEDGVIGGNDFAVTSNGASDGLAWKAFDNNPNTTCYLYGVLWITFYNPLPLNVTSLTIDVQSGSYNTIKSATVYGSNDNATWTEIASGTSPSVSTPLTIDMPSNTNSYKYYKINGTANWGGNAYSTSGIYITANQISIIESTEDDYDFYKEDTKYYASTQGV